MKRDIEISKRHNKVYVSCVLFFPSSFLPSIFSPSFSTPLLPSILSPSSPLLAPFSTSLRPNPPPMTSFLAGEFGFFSSPRLYADFLTAVDSAGGESVLGFPSHCSY